MTAQDKLAQLRFEDPAAAALVVDVLWAQLAREEPRMFAALWRRANRPARRPANAERAVPVVEWLDELPPVEIVDHRLPAVNLLPEVYRLPEVAVVNLVPEIAMQRDASLVIEPSPSLEGLLQAEYSTYVS